MEEEGHRCRADSQLGELGHNNTCKVWMFNESGSYDIHARTSVLTSGFCVGRGPGHVNPFPKIL